MNLFSSKASMEATCGFLEEEPCYVIFLIASLPLS